MANQGKPAEVPCGSANLKLCCHFIILDLGWHIQAEEHPGILWPGQISGLLRPDLLCSCSAAGALGACGRDPC